VIQFAVYENLFKETQEEYPFFLNVQHALHSTLDSRMVLPMSKYVEKIKGLSPLFPVNDEQYVAVAHEMFSVPTVYMGKEVEDLSKHSSEIIDAIDFLITGF
jgi:toxin CcdB